MPTLGTHVQVTMPPIGSSGSGLVRNKDIIHPLKDENKVKHIPIAGILYQSGSIIRSTMDSVTLVASKMCSISCKPSNLVNFI